MTANSDTEYDERLRAFSTITFALLAVVSLMGAFRPTAPQGHHGRAG